MEIKQIKNYKDFARNLENLTSCSVKIKVVGEDHFHYQLNDKYDMSLGILCVDHGEASFAPFETHDTVKNEQYINISYFPQFDDFCKVLSVLKEMFVISDVEN